MLDHKYDRKSEGHLNNRGRTLLLRLPHPARPAHCVPELVRSDTNFQHVSKERGENDVAKLTV